ncbi:eukaryotic integral membrane protein-domain-containing protein [Lentinula raphanica]|uniref:Eukaryotic integral membrane protein-domain-containing protein n=1 Tax=Lentinula raphanica TaxID=153919 RepID=A0AA38P1Z3_9AGAR|nr:eukaryotic integral membrane protein-domain-containing protein [Lentinula raphanica]KAJ3834814.1 eukaryotic integral membrane protein-domain-containing protein [Lentinula raphanica]
MAVLQSPITFLASIPTVTRYFTLATVIVSLVHAWLQWNSDRTKLFPYLVLVPGSSLFYPWTFVTSALVEETIWELVITIITIPPTLRYLERLWGSLETFKFIVATVCVSNIIAFGFNWIEFVATSNADLFLYGMNYHGQMSLQIGVLVAFTQLIPEHQVQFLGFLKMRVKSLPMIYLTLSTVMTILGFQSPWIIIQFGWFVSWIYLRFYKKNSNDTVGGGQTYGDRSETFSLVSWFPPFTHVVLGPGGNFVYKWASKFHLIPSHGGDVESGFNTTPGSARAEAERRRAMALQALDQRLAHTNSSPQSAAPVSAHTPRPPPAVASPRPEKAAATNEDHLSKASADSVDGDSGRPDVDR